MDTTAIITLVVSACIVLFAVLAVVGAFYGLLVFLPRQMEKRIAERKASGIQGEATIMRLPESINRGYRSGRNAMYRMIPIGLEIRIPGLEPYQVDKTFTLPSRSVPLLDEGKVVPVWVDP